MFSWFTRKSVKPAQLSWIEQYLSRSFKIEVDESTEFVALDCETTGMKKKDSVLTIGAILFKKTDIYLHKILDQRYPGNTTGNSAEIHGELVTSTGDYKSKNDNLRELVHFLENRVVVGHNIGFDLQMINRLLKEEYGIKLGNRTLDTANMALRLDPVKYEREVGGVSNLGLDQLCNLYGIRIENRHTALGDAFLTAQLFQKLWHRLAEKGIVLDEVMSR